MNTWIYPGWTQGHERNKIQEKADRNVRSVEPATDSPSGEDTNT